MKKKNCCKNPTEPRGYVCFFYRPFWPINSECTDLVPSLDWYIKKMFVRSETVVKPKQKKKIKRLLLSPAILYAPSDGKLKNKQ